MFLQLYLHVLTYHAVIWTVSLKCCTIAARIRSVRVTLGVVVGAEVLAEDGGFESKANKPSWLNLQYVCFLKICVG
jgi:hypothetical protein